MKITLYLILIASTTLVPCVAQLTGRRVQIQDGDQIEDEVADVDDEVGVYREEVIDALRTQLEIQNFQRNSVSHLGRARGLKQKNRRLHKKSKGKKCALTRKVETACEPLDSGADLPVCAGLRGNGPRIFSHFSVLARLVEDLGPLDGISGGSSGAISLMIHDAIISSKVVTECYPGVCCSSDEQNARISFLLRSFDTFMTTFLPIMAASSLLVLEQVMKKIDDKKILENLLSDNEKKRQKGLKDFLKLMDKDVDDAPLIKTFLNPDVPKTILQSPNPEGMAQSIIEGFQSTGNFVSEGPIVFIRPSILNWEAIAELFDVLASFLHGSKPANVDGMRLLLSQCAVLGDVSWIQSSERLVYSGEGDYIGTCKDIFAFLMADFVFARDSRDPSYLKKKIGANIPTTVSTGVMTEAAYDEWERMNKRYLTSSTFPVDLSDWDPPFEDVRFGYFGDKESLKRAGATVGVDSKKALYVDPKSDKFLALGEANWKKVIMTSAAEPTLSKGVKLGKDKVSVGGWVDFGPSQVLSGMGCDRTILITRQDGAGSYSQGLLTLMGASSEQLADHYDFGDPGSAWSKSAELADGTVCTDWDAPFVLDFGAIAQDGLNAPFLHSDECFESLGQVGSSQEIEGCTPGFEY